MRRRIGVLLFVTASACESIEPKAVTRELRQQELVGRWFLPKLRDLGRSDAPPERSLTLLEDGRCTIGEELWKIVTQCVKLTGYPEAMFSSAAPCTWHIAATSGASFVQLAVSGNQIPLWGGLEVRGGGYLADDLGLQARLCEGDEVEETYLARLPL